MRETTHLDDAVREDRSERDSDHVLVLLAPVANVRREGEELEEHVEDGDEDGRNEEDGVGLDKHSRRRKVASRNEYAIGRRGDGLREQERDWSDNSPLDLVDLASGSTSSESLSLHAGSHRAVEIELPESREGSTSGVSFASFLSLNLRRATDEAHEMGETEIRRGRMGVVELMGVICSRRFQKLRKKGKG